MKRLTLAAIFAILGTLVFGVDPMPYDSAAVKDLMHSNGATVGAVGKAIDAADWQTAADGFIQLAANAKKAVSYAPPKGDPMVWKQIWSDFLFAAYQGVGAAGAKDAVKAKAFLDQIVGDRNKGHPAFKG